MIYGEGINSHPLQKLYYLDGCPNDIVEFDIVNGTRIMRKIRYVRNGNSWSPEAISLPYVSILDNRAAR